MMKRVIMHRTVITLTTRCHCCDLTSAAGCVMFKYVCEKTKHIYWFCADCEHMLLV